MSTRMYNLYIALCISCFFVSCKKYLDAKSDPTLTSPGSLKDLELILDEPDMNQSISLNITGSDEYYASPEDYIVYFDKPTQDQFIWNAQTRDQQDWYRPYRIAYNANTVLDNINDITPENQEGLGNNIKGSALFHRAHAFYQVAQLFAKQYDPGSASTDMGIPLRLGSDFNVATNRPSVKETYDRITLDLKEAASLLPGIVQYKTRPSRAAAYALLARVYLQIGEYENARLYADSSLLINDQLLDYNTLDSGSETPFERFNQEVLFYGFTERPVPSAQVVAKIDSNLYNSYDDNDLRKYLFFLVNDDNSVSFKGSYNSSTYVLFTGLATDEVYFIRSESYARLGDILSAMQDLNTVMSKRWVNDGSFVPFDAATQQEALEIILNERKKELVFRGLRWSDLRRLNKEPQFAKTLTRDYLGQTYTLPPNDKRYVLLIPQHVIDLTGITQNER
jgi:starch-binding outer membrane protein, SusD/RagB family